MFKLVTLEDKLVTRISYQGRVGLVYAYEKPITQVVNSYYMTNIEYCNINGLNMKYFMTNILIKLKSVNLLRVQVN